MSSNPRRHQGRTIRQEIVIRATPQEVWDAWARHDKIDQWFVDRQVGDMHRDAVVKWMWDFFGVEIPIHVFEARRGVYLAFGGPEGAVPSALQEVTIRQEGGSTVLRLANSGFQDGKEWDEEYQGIDSGWRMALATLKHWLEHHQGRPRTHVLVVKPAGFEYDALYRLYSTRAGLLRWLASSAELAHEPLRAGDAVRLELVGGERLTGEVLAASSTELCVTWTELRGILTFKAFRMPPAGRCASLAFNGWGLDATQASRVRKTLESALERLTALLAPASGPAPSAVTEPSARGQA